MKRIALLIVLSGAVVAHAQEAGVFARMGLDARALALGQALVADVEGAAAYYNPALAVFTNQPALALSTALMALDRELQSAQLATRMPPRAGIAVVLRHAGVRNIDGRDASGYHTQTYSTDEYTLLVAFGTQVSDRLTLGLGLQFFRADLFEGLRPVQSIGLDVGVLYRVSETLHLGLAVDDLLARYTWNSADLYGPQQGSTTSDRFPVRVRLGASWTAPAGRLRLLGEYEASFTSVEVRRRRVQLAGREADSSGWAPPIGSAKHSHCWVGSTASAVCLRPAAGNRRWAFRWPPGWAIYPSRPATRCSSNVPACPQCTCCRSRCFSEQDDSEEGCIQYYRLLHSFFSLPDPEYLPDPPRCLRRSGLLIRRG